MKLKKQIHSRSLVKAEPHQSSPQGLASDVVVTIPATQIMWEIVEDTLVKAEPHQCSPQGLASDVVATTPAVSGSSGENFEPDKTDISNISGNRGQVEELTAQEPCQHAGISPEIYQALDQMDALIISLTSSRAPEVSDISGSCFPTWQASEIEAAYMASVRLEHGVSLLLDTGSPGNLCGSEWSNEMAAESQKFGTNPFTANARSR